jgi:PAS domain S-box-containing protein
MKKAKLSIAAKVILWVSITNFIVILGVHYILLKDKCSPILQASILTLILIAGILIYKKISRGLLVRLSEAMEKAAGGNLDAGLGISSNDELAFIVSNFKQILTRFKKEKSELQRYNKFASTVINSIDEAIMLLDSNFKILWINKRLGELTRFKPEEIIGGFCHRIIHRSDKPCQLPNEICPVVKVLKTKKSAHVTHTHFDREGNEVFADVSVYPIRDKKGHIIRFLHISRDVTEKMRLLNQLNEQKIKLIEYSQQLEKKVQERTKSLVESMKEAEERRLAIINMLEDIDVAHKELIKANQELRETQAQLVQSAKMAAVGQLAGGVAHEINNPLTGILNNVQLLKLQMSQSGEIPAEELQRTLDVVELASQRCKRIVQGLLRFSRVSKGEYNLTDIHEVIENTLLLAGDELRINNIELIKEFSSDLPAVNADSNRLEQVFLNLISNAKWAMKDTQEKRLIIRVSLSSDKKSIEIAFIDTGCGISKENQEKIFTPFFTTRPVGEGTGLGLSVCFGIIKEHNGNMWVESEGKGKGTTFRITLPLAESQKDK